MEAMATRIYTRSGDEGETGLFGGQHVGKDSLRLEACGTVDELNSALGVAQSMAEDAEWPELLARIQSDLFSLGADLATPEDTGEAHGRVLVARLPPERTAALEAKIDRLEEGLTPLARFILPGGAPSGSWLHFARTICRRAERRCVALSRIEPINPEILRYLNRLSDLLFVMARAANARLGMEEETWEP
jgi:cob(I)alamin adenosyltransferase